MPNKNYIVQQAIIDLSQTQYIVKDAYLKPVRKEEIYYGASCYRLVFDIRF